MAAAFTRAILRSPAETFAQGVTTSGEGPPNLALARDQHAAYARALEALGLKVDLLPARPDYPDSVFVEDAAIMLEDGFVVTRPGAPSRLAEAAAMEGALAPRLPLLGRIKAPGTLDGGDVCETDTVVLIGVGARTNAHGAGQLAAILARHGRKAELVDIGDLPGLLHLQTGLSWLGEGRMAVSSLAAHLPTLERFESVVLDPAEAYAANCLRIGPRALIAAGYPRFAQALDRLGLDPLAVEMSEFRKMDGGPSCLSLRF